MAEKVLLEWRVDDNMSCRVVERGGECFEEARGYLGNRESFRKHHITITGGELAPFADIRELRERVEKLKRAQIDEIQRKGAESVQDVRNNAVAGPAPQDVELPCTVRDYSNIVDTTTVSVYPSGRVGVEVDNGCVKCENLHTPDQAETLAAALLKAAKLAREK